MTTSSPARIGLVKINGAAGFGIRLGQFLVGSGFEDFEHAFLDLGDGWLVEAEPGGARHRRLSDYDGVDVHWCDSIYRNVTPDKRQAIVEEADKLIGVKYSFLDYEAIALHKFGLDADWLRRYIADSGHLICSQLVDLAYQRGGYQIFTDDRWAGYVTPGDIYLQDTVVHPWETISFGKVVG